MVNQRDIDNFSAACRQLYEPGLTLADFAPRSFKFISQLVPNEFVAFGSLQVATQKLDIALNTFVPDFPPAMEAFGRLMGKYSLFCWDPRVNDGRPFFRDYFFSRRQFHELDIYHDCFRLLRVDNHCAVYVPTGPDEIAFFGIERWGGRNFTDRERTLIALAQSHLASARQLARLREQDDAAGADAQLLAQAGLTHREADVLAWLAEGKTNVEIASLLRLAAQTVKEHVSAIFRKTGAANRLAATLWALETSQRLKKAHELEPVFGG